MKYKINIILAESHELFRKALIALLKTKEDFEITAEAANGKELLELLKYNKPNIVLLDVEIPIKDNRALEIIKSRFPGVRVIILSSAVRMDLMSDFMTAGASSYLSRECSVEDLFQTIRMVNQQGLFFADAASKILLNMVLKERSDPIPQTVKFNDREAKIIREICNGKTKREIADLLNLSPSTIDFYRARIYSKTKCNSATLLFRYALKNGIVALS